MNSNRRLHSVLLTLWDIARDNPNYNRKLWGELQCCLSNLETRNNLLCALLGDLLHCTDDEGNILWQEASVHSPPEGFALKFMQEELQRDKRPQMPKPEPVIPTDMLGQAIDPTISRGAGGAYDPIDDLSLSGPPPITHRTDAEARSRAAEKPPLGVDEEYDAGDESDEEDLLAFEFDLAEPDDSTG
jgi:hypothetical protein